jgi:predicted metal-dependent phosphotriesterase family hydrolase
MYISASRFIYFALFLFLAVAACRKSELKIKTVTGEIPASRMGITLPHEHVLFDMVMLDSLRTGRYNKDSVIERITPFFDALKTFKVQTFIDGTPEFMGRDPLLLAELSRKTGINIVTNTGWYASDKNIHLPHEIKDWSAEEIAQIWIGEAKNGIGNSGIKPGVINIAISGSKLTDIDKKLVAAACLTHLETGLSIMSYSGPAEGVLAQLQILKKYGVDPSAFIWLHAMVEVSTNLILTVAERGVWIALDGVQPDLNASVQISEMVKYLKFIRRLNHVLLSHDARGYEVGLPRGGTIRPYTELFDSFSLLLLSEGITKEELNMLMVKNPAEAFGVRVRKVK